MASNELLENPAELLRQVRENFIIQDDVAAIEGIDEKLNQIRSQSRQKLNSKGNEIATLESQLEVENGLVNELNSSLEQMRQESQELASQKQIVDYVKELDELEQSIVSMRSELDEKIVKLVRDSRDQDSPESSGESELLQDPVAKANILKLKLYRSMGVIIDEENDQVLIKDSNNEVDVLPIDGDLSDFFKTKFIWEKISKAKSNFTS
ncbi:kinetochore-associated Ndc80 complex subunit spc24 [Zygosaccharomyces mellis]|uniref:Kinetochore protein Spc24 n=1 Tax=Zygosaccharomyces mellis TaxID=42258 RepID=A0A4C2DZ64_9SACH|nr:kinetochore-associated Ndc80 complex subunit spc24 [Zygosaccharomyces mellis]